MWVLEALSEVPVRKPLVVLISTLGATFLLLAYFFSFNPLYQPLVYALLSLDLYCIWKKERRAVPPALLALFCFALAAWLEAEYQILFALGFSLAVGKIIFPETFRIWKWLCSSTLLILSIWISFVWQQINFVDQIVPFALLPMLHAALFAFCVYCSFLIYLLKKDPIQEAVSHYAWEARSEGATMAIQTRDLYQDLSRRLRQRSRDRKGVEDLQHFTEGMIHLCFRLQELQKEISGTNETAFDDQIVKLEEKRTTTADSIARQQYEKALANKRKQREQHVALRLQAERIRAQLLNYTSALENMKFAYSNQQYRSSNEPPENVELFLRMAQTTADNAYETSEAYQRLLTTEV